VQQDQVGLPGADLLQGLLAVGGDADVVVGGAEVGLEQLGALRVVVGDQDARRSVAVAGTGGRLHADASASGDTRVGTIPLIIAGPRRPHFVLCDSGRLGRIPRRLHDRRETLMGRLKSVIPDAITFEDVWERVGRVPLKRIRMNPPPGYATE